MCQAIWPDVTAESLLIERIKDYRLAVQGELQRFLTDNEFALEADKNKIERARRFAAETGVDKALCAVLQALWHVPPERSDEPATAHADWSSALSDAVCQEAFSGNAAARSYMFSYAGTAYTFVFQFDTERMRYGKPEGGQVELFAGNRLCCRVLVGQHAGLGSKIWGPVDILQMTLGPWVFHVVEIEEMLRIQREHVWLRVNNELIHRQANELPD